MICIVVCGLIATHVERFHWSELRDQINIDDEDLNNLFGETFNFDDHLEHDFPSGAALKIIDNHGAVSVHASDDNKVNAMPGQDLQYFQKPGIRTLHGA